jgi:monoamine oxidase
MSVVDVAVIGAGAAGLAAAKTLRSRGIGHVVLEASHRIGGRAYTEEVAPGVPFDLGAHFMHSGSINPMRRIADELGFHYPTAPITRLAHFGDRWATEAELAERDAFLARAREAIDAAGRAGRDVAVADVTDRDDRWTPLFDYLMSLWTSRDSDQISALDMYRYRDTYEDWPVREGYGALIARWGADVPVTLNAAVRAVDWSGRTVRLTTAAGTIEARKAIVTVSTGILAAGDIRFDPPLPQATQAAVAGLPLGNHNRICLVYDRNVFGDDHPQVVRVMPEDDVPMGLQIRPFGYDYVIAVTGGRYADWLERAGIQASVDVATERVKTVFGSDAAKHIVRHNVTAWGGDPWTKGAYSTALPGQADQRAVLARPIDDRLYFAGEATSTESYSTVHGAYCSGIAAATAVAESLDRVRA